MSPFSKGSIITVQSMPTAFPVHSIRLLAVNTCSGWRLDDAPLTASLNVRHTGIGAAAKDGVHVMGCSTAADSFQCQLFNSESIRKQRDAGAPATNSLRSSG